jgi:type I restriction enzyme S subunit
MIKKSTIEKITLPKDWKMLPFGDVCEISGGSQPPKPTFIYEAKEGYIRLVQVRDYRTNNFITYIPKEKAKKFCNKTDIMIGRYGPPIFGIFRGLEGAYNVALMKAIPNKELLNQEYLYWFLKTDSLVKFVEKSSKRAAGQDGVRKEVLYTYPTPLPPLPQQKQIVDILDKAFAAIDTAKANAEQNLQNAKELFENTLQILFDNKNWEHKKLGEIASFKNGMNFTKSSKGQSIEIVGVKNFKNKFWVPFEELEKVILDGEMSEAYQLKKGDIVTVRSNGNPKLIGRTLLANKVNGNVSHSGFTIRIRLNSNTLLPVFLCHYLKTSKTRKELVDSGNGVGIKSLNQGSLSSLMIPYPKSEEEQKLIVNKIEGISKQTKKLEAIYTQKIADLEEMKKSVLQKAFSGQLNTIN